MRGMIPLFGKIVVEEIMAYTHFRELLQLELEE